MTILFEGSCYATSCTAQEVGCKYEGMSYAKSCAVWEVEVMAVNYIRMCAHELNCRFYNS